MVGKRSMTQFREFVQTFWPVLVPAALGLVALYLLLPRVRGFRPLLGGVAAGLALLSGAWLWFRRDASVRELFLFGSFSGIAIISGCLLITQRNPVRAALCFAMVVLSTCGLFLLQAAPFLMATTIIVYAGAIVVTFLFVIMLAQQAGISDADQRSREPFLASLAGFVLLAAFVSVLQQTYEGPVNPERRAALGKLEALLKQTDRVIHAKNIRAVIPNEEHYFGEFRMLVRAGHDSSDKRRAQLIDLIDRADERWSDKAVKADDVRQAFVKVRRAAARFYNQQRGTLEPDPALPLSTFSGDWTSDEGPRFAAVAVPERLPADNVAALGRTLFSDYLLAVKLAGLLLLVATIGAIAIAARRPEGLR
jgi:NADH-quinone oxidoreductase subunit J